MSQIGGYYYDYDGTVKQVRLWWPMRYVCIIISLIDHFVFGLSRLPIESTGIGVYRSANNHTTQPVSIMLFDSNNTNRHIWGVDITYDQALNVAFQLMDKVPPMVRQKYMENLHADIQKDAT